MSLTVALGYRIYWAKVDNIKDLYSSFQQTLLTECGTNINQISVLFDGYTAESTKARNRNVGTRILHQLK